MNCVQALAVAAAALVVAGEPLTAPLAYAQAAVSTAAAQSQTMTRDAIRGAIGELAGMFEGSYVSPSRRLDKPPRWRSSHAQQAMCPSSTLAIQEPFLTPHARSMCEHAAAINRAARFRS